MNPNELDDKDIELMKLGIIQSVNVDVDVVHESNGFDARERQIRHAENSIATREARLRQAESAETGGISPAVLTELENRLRLVTSQLSQVRHVWFQYSDDDVIDSTELHEEMGSFFGWDREDGGSFTVGDPDAHPIAPIIIGEDETDVEDEDEVTGWQDRMAEDVQREDRPRTNPWDTRGVSAWETSEEDDAGGWGN